MERGSYRRNNGQERERKERKGKERKKRKGRNEGVEHFGLSDAGVISVYLSNGGKDFDQGEGEARRPTCETQGLINYL